MRAEIVSVGTELLLGTITDTNAAYLAQRLALLGVDCYYVSQVGDNLDRLIEILRRASDRSDLVVTTGGLGPTGDDLTREAISAMLGEEMVVDEELERELRQFFERRRVPMPEQNLKQATLIPSARRLSNPIGTAPGWWVERGEPGHNAIIVSMPGVPFEMRRMWEHEVEPRLQTSQSNVIVSRTLKILGLGRVCGRFKVRDLMSGSNPTLAPYAKQDGVHLRITAKAAQTAEAQRLIANLEAQVRERLGDAIYGTDAETPFEVARRLLTEAGYTYAVLEVGCSGAISPLAVEVGAGTSGAIGSVSVPNVEDLHRLLSSGGPAGEFLESPGRSRKIQEWTGADAVLAVSVRREVATEKQATVVNGEIVLLLPERSGLGNIAHVTRVAQTWKTDQNEVQRLLGLVALNTLRLQLMKHLRRGRE